jgi:hypothetical protein
MKKIIKINSEYFDEETKEKVEVVDEVKKEKETIKILNRFDESVIYESERTTIKEAVEEAVKKEISLESANLESANLESANLKSANLEYANLEYANLESANLKSAKTKMCVVNFSEGEYEVAKVFIEGLKR